MQVEIIDSKLIITPDTADEVRRIYALAAAWAAYDAVMNPVSGEPLCEEKNDSDCISDADQWRIHPSNRKILQESPDRR